MMKKSVSFFMAVIMIFSTFANVSHIVSAASGTVMQHDFEDGENTLFALGSVCDAEGRGIGKSVAPTIIVVMGSVVFRIIWLLTVFAYFKTLQSLYLIYVISWTLTAIAGNIYFAYHYRRIPGRDGI